MEHILDRLKMQRIRNSTAKNYLAVWRIFNKFLIRLDRKPDLWEDRVALFCAYMIDQQGKQSQTIKSYVSAIKSVLKDDGYQWDDNKLLLGALTKACKLVNDRVRTQLPITQGLLELILFELERVLDGQSYLIILYRAMFALGYYGLFRVGELAWSDHVMKAKDVHVGKNKRKILILLYSSKTHGAESEPQQVKITANGPVNKRLFFCPFQLMNQFMDLRGGYQKQLEPLFIFRDRSPVEPKHIRSILNTTLTNLGLRQELYGVHSLRIGRCSDLARRNVPLTQLKLAGRWRSTAVYRYIKGTK